MMAEGTLRRDLFSFTCMQRPPGWGWATWTSGEDAGWDTQDPTSPPSPSWKGIPRPGFGWGTTWPGKRPPDAFSCPLPHLSARQEGRETWAWLGQRGFMSDPLCVLPGARMRLQMGALLGGRLSRVAGRALVPQNVSLEGRAVGVPQGQTSTSSQEDLRPHVTVVLWLDWPGPISGKCCLSP